MKNTSKILHGVQIVTVIALLSLVTTFQKLNDDVGPPFTTKLALAKRNLLPPQILPYISFGFNNFIADGYWIRAIQDFVAWNGKEGFYIGYFKNITTLDPKFEYPYLFNILTVPLNKDVRTLDVIALISEKGMKAIPESWQIPFYIGTQYYLFTKSYQPAEKYIGIAAEKKNAPDGVYLLYSTFVAKDLYTTEEKMNLSKKLVRVIYNNTDNEVIKKLAAQGIQENIISQLLEKSILAYKEKNKRYPATVEEILSAHLVRLPQEFIDNFTVTINPVNGTFEIELRETR